MNIHIDPAEFATKLDYWEALAVELVGRAELDGVIITVEREPLKPLAMRNHIAYVHVRDKR